MKKLILGLLLSAVLCFGGCMGSESAEETKSGENYEVFEEEASSEEYAEAEIPPFSGDPYIVINDNIPAFSETDYAEESYEYYSELDDLGRCGVVIANIGSDLMPTEERGNIGHIKPTGWQSVQYDNVDGKSLYNRCHLIGFQLTAENDNEKNLITGTRFMNVQGMLPFENMIADYIHETDNHVLYRVTPVFEGDNLVASGVQMEALSVEDDGEGICFNVYAYNNQPGIGIDYATGDNWPEEEMVSEESTKKESFVLNTNTQKYHLPSCNSVQDMNPENKEEFTGSRADLESQGYEPCGNCKP